MSSSENDLDLANLHALAALVEASSKRSTVASQDIVDDRGVKLWARGQPVSESLQQRRLERKLKQPLEASLQAADGGTRWNSRPLHKNFSPLVTCCRAHCCRGRCNGSTRSAACR